MLVVSLDEEDDGTVTVTAGDLVGGGLVARDRCCDCRALCEPVDEEVMMAVEEGGGCLVSNKSGKNKRRSAAAIISRSRARNSLTLMDG